MMITESFYESVALKQAVEHSRMTRFTPGYSDVGRFPAAAPAPVVAADDDSTAAAVSVEAAEEDVPLRFYLGPNTRITLRTAPVTLC